MILENCTYEEIFNLIINGHSYRTIAERYGISATTVFNTKKRFNKTGSLYPSLNSRPLHDPVIQEVLQFIVPTTDTEQRDLLELVECRCDQASIIICSQLTAEGWHERLGGSALADSILDHIVPSAIQ